MPAAVRRLLDAAHVHAVEAMHDVMPVHYRLPVRRQVPAACPSRS
jgi:hypothetical protein